MEGGFIPCKWMGGLPLWSGWGWEVVHWGGTSGELGVALLAGWSLRRSGEGRGGRLGGGGGGGGLGTRAEGGRLAGGEDQERQRSSRLLKERCQYCFHTQYKSNSYHLQNHPQNLGLKCDHSKASRLFCPRLTSAPKVRRTSIKSP